MPRLKRPLIGVIEKLGEGVPALVSYWSYDYGSKLRGPSPIALVLLCSETQISLEEGAPPVRRGGIVGSNK
ncbi:hypothetical protein TNCV_4138291 [Trichonephila clavipes]|nr:hypothetical protein TNCV_4138291 [Trichonephila clavipes]